MNLVGYTQMLDMLIFEFMTIFHDNIMQDSKLTNNMVQDETRYFLPCCQGQWGSFDPLNEIFSCYDEEFMVCKRRVKLGIE